MTADRPRRARAGRNQQKLQRLPSVSSDDDSSDENSVTRCICHKIPSLVVDNDGMMVQCDNCNVWQHCPCVGLEGISEDEMPDQYYCEECKPENHVMVDSYGRYRRVYDPKGLIQQSQRAHKKRTTMNSADATDSIPELYQILASDNNGHPPESISPSMTSDTITATTAATNSTSTTLDIDDTIGPRFSKRRRSTTSTSDTSRSAQATKRDLLVKPSRSTSPTALKQNVDQENKTNGRGTKRRTVSDRSAKLRASASPQIAFKELPDGINTRRRGGNLDIRQKSSEAGEVQDMEGEDEQENEAQNGHTITRRRGAAAANSRTKKLSNEPRRRGKAVAASPLSPNLDRHVPSKHSPLITHKEDMDTKIRAPLSPYEERLSDTESPRMRAKTPPTKIRYPSNKMSLGDMDKRASQILRYINRMQLTMTKKQRSGYHRQDAHAQIDPVLISKPLTENCSNGNINGNNKLVGELEVASGNAPAIVLQRSLSISSMASSLSSASTIPLNEDDGKSTKGEEEEKCCIPAPEHATALEIMDRLACELVKFQTRFGPQKSHTHSEQGRHNHQPDDRLPVRSV
ncbi:hypothetical protein K450DRAFT_246048 [Umbelopsis ramanniana AG]|uniref:PHD-type domain-containing protein n=1 Tax=Umbelopsis ramanniana AG TaxID=1314678 RepID=A0AAD5E8I9_UMBRA|nr:uncharacterized protein K450DRAFT_246048 [Umbelopsis ramanniana AG]KAI8578689.1 hypothetical protein K450DRAFT_246048 [Umbelopsis ramanniana AG]